MAFINIPKEIFAKLEVLQIQANLSPIGDIAQPIKRREIRDFVLEAFSFYFAYLSFLVNEKHTITVLKDLVNSEDPETALNDADQLIEAMFKHFAPDAFTEYLRTRKLLLEKILKK